MSTYSFGLLEILWKADVSKTSMILNKIIVRIHGNGNPD